MDITEVSQHLFGRGMRLPIAAWIRSQPGGAAFYQRELAHGAGVDEQYVRRELDSLCALGMVVRERRAQGEVRQYYNADRDHPLWSIIDIAVVAVERTEPASKVRAL